MEEEEEVEAKSSSRCHSTSSSGLQGSSSRGGRCFGGDYALWQHLGVAAAPWCGSTLDGAKHLSTNCCCSQVERLLCLAWTLGYPIVQLSSTFDTVEMVVQPVTAAAAGFAIFCSGYVWRSFSWRPGSYVRLCCHISLYLTML